MNLPQQIRNIRAPKTQHKILASINSRFSPRVFSPEEVSSDDLRIIFEAARLTPSGRNRQPWFYFWIRKKSFTYKKIKQCIPERNNWALTAPLIIMACYDPTMLDKTINKWAQYDLGASVISLILQAQELEYHSRQIGSFYADITKQTFAIPDPYIPFTLIAMGKIGSNEDYQKTDNAIIERELIPWSRKEKIDKEIIK